MAQKPKPTKARTRPSVQAHLETMRSNAKMRRESMSELSTPPLKIPTDWVDETSEASGTPLAPIGGPAPRPTR